MSDVFVSYSRRDAAFVSQLVASIEGRGKDVWVDTEGIADGEVFPEAIKRAIEQSDAFVFVITPESVASSYCENEVEYARELQKRIVPLLRASVADSQLPEEIRVRNWIPFTDTAEFEVSVDRLVGALDTDLEAMRAHTRWLVKALEWDGEGRERSFLLRGAELGSAEAWLARSHEDAEPAPTQLQREYLLASREAAARRQRTLVGASLAVAFVSVGLLVFALISRGEAIDEQHNASSRALASESEAQLTVDPEISVLLGVRAVRTKPTPEAMFALREALDTSPLQLSLSGGTAAECFPIASYDPRGGEIAEHTCDGSIELLNPATGAVIRRTPSSSEGSNIPFSPTGSLLAVASRDGVTLLDGSTLAVRRRLTGFASPDYIAFSPDGRTLAATGVGGVELWNLATGASRALVLDRTHPEQSNYIGVAFTANGRQLVVGTQLNYAAVVDVRSGRVLHRIPAFDGGVQIAADPAGPEVAVTTGSSTTQGFAVTLWSTKNWRAISTPVKISGTAISAIAFSPNGRELAVGGDDGTAGLWSVGGGQELVALVGHTAGIDSISFAPGGRALLTGSADGTLREWRATGAQQLEVHLSGVVEQLAAAPDRLLVLGYSSTAATLSTLSLPGGQPLGAPLNLGFSELNGFNQLAVRITPDAHFALAYGKFGPKRVSVWNIAQRRPVHELPPVFLDAASLSPDGTRLAEMVHSGPLRIVSLTGGQTVTLAGSSPECLYHYAAFSPDGRYLVGASFCGPLDVWNAHTGRLIRRFNEGGQIAAVAMASDDAHVAIASWDTTATLLDFRTGRKLALTGHTGGVNNIAYSPDGRYVLSTSVDDTARLWEAGSGQLLRIFRQPALVNAPAFSPNGQLVFTADETGAIRGWETCPACSNPSALLGIAERGQLGIHKLTTLEQTAARGG